MSFAGKMNRRTFVAGVAAATAVCGTERTALLAASQAGQETPSIWGNGQLFAFSALDGMTDYASGLVARSMDGPVGVEVVLPAEAMVHCGERVTGPVQITSDTFLLTTETGTVRGAFVDAQHILIDGPCRVTDVASALNSVTRDGRTLVGVRTHFNPELLRLEVGDTMAKRQRWLLAQRIPSRLPSRRRHTLRKALSVMKGQVNSSEGTIQHRWTTPDRWPHRDLWLWDSVFHALGWRHVDIQMARDAVAAVFDGQRPDGCIPHQLSPVKFSAVTQPPLLAFGVQQLAGSPPDGEWVGRYYPKLARYLQWDFEHRVTPDPVAHWFIDPDPLSRSGESGMDNSPRFDAATRLYAVDFNAFLSMECAVMAEFATMLELPHEAVEWRRKHDELNRQMNALMWNEEAGFYFDYNPAAKAQTKVSAVSGFLPLLCGAANEHQVRRLVAHMENPKTFGTAVPLPSAVAGEGFANPHDMWRGPMWVNTNWLVAHGLERVGRMVEASRLREKTMDEIERRYMELGSLFEFYDEDGATAPDKLPRKGRLDPASPYHQAIHDYGWTSTLYADLVFSHG
jgi:putative isomerase